MFSGALTYVRKSEVRATDLNVAQIWSIIEARGIGSGPICAQLAQDAGSLERTSGA
jgi:uncharacterized membrane protein